MARWVFGVFLLLAWSAPASAVFDHLVPTCDSHKVLKVIAHSFAWAERHTWHRGFVIDGLTNTRESGYNDFGPSRVERRYCNGTAWLSNGRQSQVVYVIEGGQGFAGVGWRVEFCLPPYDPWRVYDAWCKSIRP